MTTDQRVPALNYNNVKPAALKQAMAELGVPVDKRTEKDLAYLVKRHQTYALIHNANLDADPKRRKTSGQLRKELEEWDRRYRAEGAAGGAGEKKDDEGPLADEGSMRRHEKKYEGQFGDLIRMAREGEMKRREAKKTVRLATPPQAPASEPEYISDSTPSSSQANAGPDANATTEAKELAPPRPPTPPFPSTFLPSLSNPGPSPPPSPSGLDEDIPLERAPEIDPFEQQLSRAGPYEDWKVPAPSQNFGVRREGMGFNDEGREKGLEDGARRRGAMEVVQEEEEEDA